LKLPNLCLLLLLLPFTAIASEGVESSLADHCDIGYELSKNSKNKEAIPELSLCLIEYKDDPKMQRWAYLARAWAYYETGSIKLAATDSESAFNLSPACTHGELINYSLYLRKLGRYSESLKAAEAAAEIEVSKNEHPSMMTQYHLGWSLQELKRHQEAIDAFTKGIPMQPIYVSVYFRRGLSYEAIGNKEKALLDFHTAARLSKEQDTKTKEPAFYQELKLKFDQYGIK
jgi:tetratricopeptide (TPR) repeat protein